MEAGEKVDWATAEALALGTLLCQGVWLGLLGETACFHGFYALTAGGINAK